MRAFKIGDTVKRIASGHDQCEVGEICVVRGYDSYGDLLLEGKNNCTFSERYFILVSHRLLKFGQMEIKDRLEIVGAYMEGVTIEHSSCGDKWLEKSLPNEDPTAASIIFVLDKFYRIKDNTETLKAIADIQTKMDTMSTDMKSLSVQLQELKGSL